MRKLKLDLDAVVVESFSTAFDARERGTVDGLAEPAASIAGGGFECTVDGCSGDCTGYPGCSDDGYCSEAYRCTGIGVCFWTP
jgi:hypothetical protein